VEVLEKNAFNPDVIIAHAENPQVYQLYYLKKQYTNARTCLVLHGVKYLGRPNFKEWKDTYLFM
jgi:hypothetical protein